MPPLLTAPRRGWQSPRTPDTAPARTQRLDAAQPVGGGAAALAGDGLCISFDVSGHAVPGPPFDGVAKASAPWPPRDDDADAAPQPQPAQPTLPRSQGGEQEEAARALREEWQALQALAGSPDCDQRDARRRVEGVRRGIALVRARRAPKPTGTNRVGTERDGRLMQPDTMAGRAAELAPAADATHSSRGAEAWGSTGVLELRALRARALGLQAERDALMARR